VIALPSRIADAAAKAPTWLIALAAGLLAALAHPPFGVLPGLLAYGVMMRLGDTAPSRWSAFRRGWFVGLGYFGLGCWWVAEAFLVDAETFGWMAPFAVILLAGGLALFWGAALALYRALALKGVLRLLAFAALLSAAEWTRGHILTGFPWNLPGETWAAGGAVSQFAAVVGAYGLTFITLAIAAAPALLWRAPGRRAAMAVIAGAAAVLAGLVIYGVSVLARPAERSGLLVRVVQPDVAQAAKYDRDAYDSIVARYVALTARPSSLGTPALVIWPEGAIPAAVDSYLAPGHPTRAAIAAALKPGQILLIGAYRFGGPEADAAVYNTLIAVRREASDIAIVGVYDKHRLVPFGEYMPLESVLSPLGIKKLVPLDSFSSGPPPRPLRLPGGPVIQPLICYESLFPGLTRAGARAAGVRPDLIVNISNDAWFGVTSGPLQHLNLASYRAIEQGLPMVRATPTGVSAIIDAQGRVLSGKQLGLAAFGVIDARGRVQTRLTLGVQGVADHFAAQPRGLTPYARGGELAFVALLLLSGLINLRELILRQKTA
jgi:apolipoprotein N-acyltransferase